MPRTALKTAFIVQNGLENAHIQDLPSDASFRCYSRIKTADTSYMLMDSPPDKEPTDSFIKIGQHLTNLGYSAPKIIAKDTENGFLLLEDFGDDTYTALLKNGSDYKDLYTLAIDTLADMCRNEMITAVNAQPYDMPTYLREVNLFIEWFFPLATGQKATPRQKIDWEYAWAAALQEIPRTRPTLVLRDFHAGNIMLLDNKKDLEKCGLLDFQDALIGHCAYDVASLLQDVRLDIPEDIEQYCIERFKEKSKADNSFDIAYEILAGQRHAKVLGIFVRLLKRDNKDVYIKYLPRTAKLFLKAIKNPVYKEVSDWIDTHCPNISETVEKLQ